MTKEDQEKHIQTRNRYIKAIKVVKMATLAILVLNSLFRFPHKNNTNILKYVYLVAEWIETCMHTTLQF